MNNNLSADSLSDNLIKRVNVGDMLTRTAWRMPGKEALIDISGNKERRLTYAEFNVAVNRFAHALLRLGCKRGDALVLISANSIEFLVTYYACAKTGIVCVPINLAWGEKEVAYVLQHCSARAIVAESQLLDLAGKAMSTVTTIRDIIIAPGTSDTSRPEQKEMGVNWHEFNELCKNEEPDELNCYVKDRDPISYLYTSGTTSAPKAVVSSHLAVYLESTTPPVVAGFSAKDRSAAMMPLFHTAQLNGVITPLVYVGGTAFLLRGFDPEKLLELISREKITHIFGLPMMYRMMLDHPNFKKYDLSSLRLALYAMAPMPDIDLRRAIDSFGCDFMLGFGQTEMNPLTTMFMPEHQLSHSGSVGTQIPNVQTAIMGEDGNLLPIGESGEIVYRGPHVMEGYLHNDKATAEAFEHGWFHSGDVGHFDADGVLWFEDRKKDVIKTGGENVASIEVERALYDAEERIGEVVVVGLYHERWGEAVTAFVVPKPADVGTLTPLHIQAAAKNCLDGFKQPKAVIILEELPRTATGKVQKNVLRDRYRDYYRTNLS